MTLHTLENEYWQVGILPQTGVSVAFGRVRDAASESWIDVLRPTTESNYDSPSLTASFLMLPWCNRIRDARFRFRGRDYQLQPNNAEGTASHGVTRSLTWVLQRSSSEHLIATFDSDDYADLNFPFKFSVRAEFSVSGRDFSIAVTLTNDDTRPFPAGFGHHPYFVRDAANAVQVEIACDQRFELEGVMVVAPPVPVTPETDFRHLRPLGTRVYEELYTGRQSNMLAARVVYPDHAVALLADPMFAHILLFAPEGKPFFAVEPQSIANDGFNLYDRGVDGNGVFVLEPGESKSGMISFHLEESA